MNIDDSLLNYEEALTFKLRALYDAAGFKRFQMSKFEAYDLYAQFKDFLGPESIITFTDTDGKLMALKPDVTLFYAANNKVEPGDVGRVYYNENVYRVTKTTGTFKEIMQVGVECLGDTTPADLQTCLVLAAQSLETISPEYMLSVTSLDITQEALCDAGLSPAQQAQAKAHLTARNVQGLRALANDAHAAQDATDKLIALLPMPEDADAWLAKLPALGFSFAAVSALATAVADLAAAGFSDHTRIDFSLVNNTAYYNGLAFQGFVAGAPRAVLMGGQYDNLLDKMSRRQRGLGFAVYMDRIRSVRA